MLKKITSAPYLLWSAIFIVVPIIMVAIYSFGQVDPSSNEWTFTFDNYKRFFEPIYLKVLLKSIKIAFEATAVCLLIGYPMAMILATMKEKNRAVALMIFMVPMWMNSLLRTYAWFSILGKNGLLNRFLELLGFMPRTFLYTEGAVLLVMVYNFLPFMVLPIYTVLTKLDSSLIEAAEDLGGNRWNVFRKVTFPLSLAGVLSGISMVFMPAVSSFVIPNLIYGGQYMLIGNLIEQQFLTANNWYFGSAISMILMVIILITMAIMNHLGDGNDLEGGGMSLW